MSDGALKVKAVLSDFSCSTPVDDCLVRVLSTGPASGFVMIESPVVSLRIPISLIAEAVNTPALPADLFEV